AVRRVPGLACRPGPVLLAHTGAGRPAGSILGSRLRRAGPGRDHRTQGAWPSRAGSPAGQCARAGTAVRARPCRRSASVGHLASGSKPAGRTIGIGWVEPAVPRADGGGRGAVISFGGPPPRLRSHGSAGARGRRAGPPPRG